MTDRALVAQATRRPSRQRFIAALLAAPGPTRGALLALLLAANYGAGATNALRAVTGAATIPGDPRILGPFLDYLLARTAEHPAALARLREAAPKFSAAITALPPAALPADEIQNAVRSLAGRPPKRGRAPPRPASGEGNAGKLGKRPGKKEHER